MPDYDYRCEKCGDFAVKQRITEDTLSECPHCGAPVKRIISHRVGVMFKGSGFYKTDVQGLKDRARAVNKERQVDNQALLDGDVSGFVAQSDATTKKLADAGT
ncbi:MAG: zinc ribbon domain-containing protein [Syntrophomonadaceae bacterium]|nr:zinc ribbon domain-containing protein [Syntrophomonadaceae bacterium]